MASDIAVATNVIAKHAAFFFSSIFCVVIYYSHVNDPNNSFWTYMLPASSTNPIILFLRNEIVGLQDFVLMAPTIFDAPSQYMIWVFAANFAIAFFGPILTVFQVAVYVLLVQLFNWSPPGSVKLLTIFMTIFWLYECYANNIFADFGGTTTTSTSMPTSTTPAAGR